MCLCVIWCAVCTVTASLQWNIWFCGTDKKAAQQFEGHKVQLVVQMGPQQFFSFQVATKCLGLLLCLATSNICTAEKFSCREQWNSDHCVTMKHQHHAANLHTAATITIPVKLPAPKGAILGQCYLLYWQLTWHFIRMNVKNSERK